MLHGSYLDVECFSVKRKQKRVRFNQCLDFLIAFSIFCGYYFLMMVFLLLDLAIIMLCGGNFFSENLWVKFLLHCQRGKFLIRLSGNDFQTIFCSLECLLNVGWRKMDFKICFIWDSLEVGNCAHFTWISNSSLIRFCIKNCSIMDIKIFYLKSKLKAFINSLGHC